MKKLLDVFLVFESFKSCLSVFSINVFTVRLVQRQRFSVFSINIFTVRLVQRQRFSVFSINIFTVRLVQRQRFSVFSINIFTVRLVQRQRFSVFSINIFTVRLVQRQRLSVFSINIFTVRLVQRQRFSVKPSIGCSRAPGQATGRPSLGSNSILLIADPSLYQLSYPAISENCGNCGHCLLYRRCNSLVKLPCNSPRRSERLQYSSFTDSIIIPELLRCYTEKELDNK